MLGRLTVSEGLSTIEQGCLRYAPEKLIMTISSTDGIAGCMCFENKIGLGSRLASCLAVNHALHARRYVPGAFRPECPMFLLIWRPNIVFNHAVWRGSSIRMVYGSPVESLVEVRGSCRRVS